MYPLDHILVVEDDSDHVMVIQEGLRRGRVANPLFAVGSSDEAIAYFKGDGAFSDRERHPLPCLVLLDLKLPGSSGFKVLKWLREQPKFKRLPVIILTGSRDSADVEKAYELGANSYLAKPHDLADLCTLVNSLNNYWLHLAQKPRL